MPPPREASQTFSFHVPTMPYRCAPAPYERACQVAFYFSTRKPRSKVIVLDANAEVQSKKEIFTAAWNERYKGIVDYRPDSELADVDASTLTVKLVFDDVKADVLNVIPPQRAAAIARQLGMANSNARFCQVDFVTYESTVQPGVHLRRERSLRRFRRIRSFPGVFEDNVPLTSALGTRSVASSQSHCFVQKGMPEAAVMWFKKGLASPGHSEDEYQALRYELGGAYEELGDVAQARQYYTEVYGVDVNYREVADKLSRLKQTK